MQLTVKSSNRWCAAEGRTTVTRAKRDIYLGRGVCGDFSIMHTDIPAFERTVFKVYAAGRELMIALCLGQAVDRFDQGDDVEIFFDPCHDHLGFHQFIFTADGQVGTYTHLPYAQAHSSSYPRIRLAGHAWQDDANRDVIGVSARVPWLVARFSLAEVFRNGPCCGFNIARYSAGLNEPQSWNRFTGHRLQDPTGFGHLYWGVAPVQVEVGRAELEGNRLELRGAVTPADAAPALELVDPLGRLHRVAATPRASGWQATLDLADVPTGRWRIYPRIEGKPVEPDFLFFDLAAEDKPFTLCMTYDSPDDMRANFYTPERLERQLAQVADLGIGRVYWIDYPAYRDWPAFWDWASNAQYARASFDACGDVLPLAARISKQKGMGFVGIFKPFDLGFTGHFADAPRQRAKAAGYGVVRDFDGSYTVAWPPIARNQQWTMQSNPAWRREFAPPITRVCFYSETPLPRVRSGEVVLWTSDDNGRYRRYSGPGKVRCGVGRFPHYRWTPAGKMQEPGRRKNWYLELVGLRLISPFLAVEARGKTLGAENRRFLFVEATDAQGRDVPVTLSSVRETSGAFRFLNKWSWANYTDDVLDSYRWNAGPVGLHFGQPERITTVLEPAFPEVRALWLGQVERILKTDADGVDIRTLCHHNTCVSWLQYAFAGPVRDRFRERYGREVQPVPEDYQRIREIRGQCYTDFIRQASTLARQHRKKFSVHLEPGIEVPATHDVRMAMCVEWRRWIEEGLLDEITLKYWSANSRFVHEQILPLARARGIAVYHSESNFALNTPRAKELAEVMTADARRAGLSGFAFYEECSYFNLNGQGESWPIGSADRAIRRAAAALRQRNPGVVS